MAIWIEVSLAVGMRVKWRRWRVESTRAMLKSGQTCQEKDGCIMYDLQFYPCPFAWLFVLLLLLLLWPLRARALALVVSP